MAPKNAPHRANNGKRFLPKTADHVPTLRPEFDLEPSDAEAGALQPWRDVKEPEWEGVDEEHGEVEAEGKPDSDEESVDMAVEHKEKRKKKDKPVLPKDAEEEDLERLVFGDTSSFKQGIAGFSLAQTSDAIGDNLSDERDEGADYEDMADQDLFFIDSGPVSAPPGSLVVKKIEDTEAEGDPPAWVDSDDERLVVSLASVPQLRKLRETAEDDMVNGQEYMLRLRKQYEKLYPTPEWAIYATGKAKRKRRHTTEDSASDEGSASDMDVDEEDLSTQPLARLLKDADILSQISRRPAKRRKLQAGTVDIQRLKDVAKAGPVCIGCASITFSADDYTVRDNVSFLSSHISAAPVLRS